MSSILFSVADPEIKKFSVRPHRIEFKQVLDKIKIVKQIQFVIIVADFKINKSQNENVHGVNTSTTLVPPY